MKRILIVNQTLMVGGGEKLLYELVVFALSQGYKVDVLILDNFREEYYDQILTDLGASIHRIPSNWRKMKKTWYFLKWHIRLRYFLKNKYSSTIIINLDFSKKVLRLIRKPNSIHIWHISNLAQYRFNNNLLPYDKNILKNETYNLWLINKYQKEELEEQEGEIKCKIHDFKLFLNKK